MSISKLKTTVLATALLSPTLFLVGCGAENESKEHWPASADILKNTNIFQDPFLSSNKQFIYTISTQVSGNAESGLVIKKYNLEGQLVADNVGTLVSGSFHKEVGKDAFFAVNDQGAVSYVNAASNASWSIDDALSIDRNNVKELKLKTALVSDGSLFAQWNLTYNNASDAPASILVRIDSQGQVVAKKDIIVDAEHVARPLLIDLKNPEQLALPIEERVYPRKTAVVFLDRDFNETGNIAESEDFSVIAFNNSELFIREAENVHKRVGMDGSLIAKVSKDTYNEYYQQFWLNDGSGYYHLKHNQLEPTSPSEFNGRDLKVCYTNEAFVEKWCKVIDKIPNTSFSNISYVGRLTEDNLFFNALQYVELYNNGLKISETQASLLATANLGRGVYTDRWLTYRVYDKQGNLVAGARSPKGRIRHAVYPSTTGLKPYITFGESPIFTPSKQLIVKESYSIQSVGQFPTSPYSAPVSGRVVSYKRPEQ